MTRGAVMVVYGDQADLSATIARDALERVCPDLPVTVYRDRAGMASDMQESRWAKVTLLDWSPYDHTVYLDADTQVIQSIEAGFQMLADGWELVIAQSQNQTDHEWLWHCGNEDRGDTLTWLGFQALQLQAGVLFVANTPATRALWECWRREWERYSNQDQGALLRALYQVPVKVWVLGRPWNGGAVIGHRWGAIRRNGHG